MPRPIACLKGLHGIPFFQITPSVSGSSHIPHPTSRIPHPTPTSHIQSVTLAHPPQHHLDAPDPGWQKWLTLVEFAVAESQRPEWTDCVLPAHSRAPDSPLLHNATLRIDAEQASRVVTRLAGELGIIDVERVDPLSLILSGIERDAATLDGLASRLAITTDVLAVLAQVSALPLLLNAARKLDPEASRTWQRGYCPVCGAWPSMAEMRGIQRERRMRCGCCGSDWLLPVLRCAFCDETDHQKLAFLLDEEGGQHIRVETCSTCHGYLKTLTTLGMLPFTTLAVKDMSTIAFDLAAQNRGYSRPSRPGFRVEVEIVQ
jgi:FdhE protein